MYLIERAKYFDPGVGQRTIFVAGSLRFRRRIANALLMVERSTAPRFTLEKIQGIIQHGTWWSYRPFISLGSTGVVLLNYNSIRTSNLSLASYLIYLNCFLGRTTLVQRLNPRTQDTLELELDCLRTQFEFVESFDSESILRHSLVMNYQIIKHRLVSAELCDWSEANG